MERSLSRFQERLTKMYDRTFGSVEVPKEERGQLYLTIAGDPPAQLQWMRDQAQTHGWPLARTMFKQMVLDGEGYVNELVKDVQP